jgi:hypothetical protein
LPATLARKRAMAVRLSATESNEVAADLGNDPADYRIRQTHADHIAALQFVEKGHCFCVAPSSETP